MRFVFDSPRRAPRLPLAERAQFLRAIGDEIAAGEIFVMRQVRVEDRELALGFHRVAVDRIFCLERCLVEEMAEATADEGGRAHGIQRVKL